MWKGTFAYVKVLRQLTSPCNFRNPRPQHKQIAYHICVLVYQICYGTPNLPSNHLPAKMV